MLDRNEFKRKVKEWMREHPEGSEQDLADYCDELIPANQFAVNFWLVEQTVSWYRCILSGRERERSRELDEGE